jgi:hypothetical protein
MEDKMELNFMNCEYCDELLEECICEHCDDCGTVMDLGDCGCNEEDDE